jgi:hypothetical protein
MLAAAGLIAQQTGESRWPAVLAAARDRTPAPAAYAVGVLCGNTASVRERLKLYPPNAM